MSKPDCGTLPGPILVGLSAHNEGKTVAHVAQVVSEGLRQSFPNHDTAIVLANSCSTDDTCDNFSRSDVDVRTIIRNADDDQHGKGNAVRLILEEAVSESAAAVVFIDADVESLRPDWIRSLAAPALDGYDLVEPLYLRSPRDGAVTRHFAHPLVVALAGLNIRQPVGGEFAVSGAFARHLLDRKWPDAARGYGIDIFATLCAASDDRPIASARLGVKLHRPNPAKLARIFSDVAETAFALSVTNTFPHEHDRDVKEIPTFGEHMECPLPPGGIHVRSFIDVARSAWAESTRSGQIPLTPEVCSHVESSLARLRPSVDVGLWHECLAQGVASIRNGVAPGVAAEALLAPFLARTATFWEEARGHAPEEVERAIMSDALRFRGILRATLRSGQSRR